MIRMFDDTVAVMQPAASRGHQGFLSMFSDSNLNLDMSVKLWQNQNQNQQRAVWLWSRTCCWISSSLRSRPSWLSLLWLAHEGNSCFCFHVECEAAQKNRKCAERSGPADMLESCRPSPPANTPALPHSSHFRPEANQRQIFVFVLNRKKLSADCCWACSQRRRSASQEIHKNSESVTWNWTQ